MISNVFKDLAEVSLLKKSIIRETTKFDHILYHKSIDSVRLINNQMNDLKIAFLYLRL